MLYNNAYMYLTQHYWGGGYCGGMCARCASAKAMQNLHNFLQYINVNFKLFLLGCIHRVNLNW